MQRTTVEEHFESKYIPEPMSGCFIWMDALSDFGYGYFWDGKKGRLAHRASYELHSKSPIPAGLMVLHNCDNPCCVNPDHLRVGTAADNMRDKVIRGRAKGQSGGTAHTFARLTEDQVRAIRADHRLQRVIGAEYGIDRRHVGSIQRKERWASLT